MSRREKRRSLDESVAALAATEDTADALVPLDQVTVVGRIHSPVNIEGSDQDSGSEGGFPATQAVDYNFEETQDPTGIASSQDSESDNDSCEIVNHSPEAGTLVATDIDAQANRDAWMRQAMAIPIPDLLRWIEQNSDFVVSEAVQETKRLRISLSSSAFIPDLDRPEPFLGLNSSPALVHGFNAVLNSWEKHKPKPIRELIGKYVVPRDMFNVNMGTYRVTDEAITGDALKYPQEIPPFITLMKPNYSATVREEDLKRFEENARRSLLILSSLDTTLSALIRVYPDSESPDTSFMRALFRTSQGLSALSELASASLHQAVIHRRDSSINARLFNKQKPVYMSEDHISALRNGPILGEEYLFHPDILHRLQQERLSSNTERLQQAMMTKLVHDSKTPPVKRTWSQESASVSGSAVTVRQSGQKPKRPKTQSKAPATVSSPQFPSGQAGQGNSNR